ncbi:MAG: ATP-binding cassette domain-containing protein [Methanosarcinales archaeon]|uniref:Molybdate/tungstate import ATP-binding protein WtpC n=1 Tax=Candidatus Ethanoperedens thermophilum TaxID=2766897 RepID=A0A848D9E5_9EURY|nr:ATP-binding cassette domain-containing protein [Candidatus Ethanoperedens thermophilum]
MNYKLEIRNITKTFRTNNNEMNVLENVNLNVKPNEFLCIIGPSGCGKTTLLRMIAGLDHPNSGEIILDGEEVKEPSPDRGMVFQEFSLFPWRTVIKNVTFGLEIKEIDKEEQYRIANECINLVGLKGFENHYPYELSGGMKQRAAIARALANDPSILLMDEPFGSVDAQTRNILQEELLEIWERTKKTVLFVTHSIDEAVYLADRVIVMSARPGSIVECMNITVARPRKRTSTEANELRERLLTLLKNEKRTSTEALERNCLLC